MAKYAQGKFCPRNSEKYVGKKDPVFRSSWEMMFMTFLDNNPSVIQWASESIHINYHNPLTGKNTIYIPDFFIYYQDVNGKNHAEIVEVKPKKEIALESAKSQRDKAAVIVNQAKWAAARAFCSQHGMVFRVITEEQLFFQGKKR